MFSLNKELNTTLVLVTHDIHLADLCDESLTLSAGKVIKSSLSDSDIYESNKSFIRMLSDGFILKREDRSQKDIYIQLIDYTGLSKQQHKKDNLTHIVADPEIEYGEDNR